MRRFREAELNLNFRSRLKTLDDLRKEDETTKKRDLIAVKGHVKVVLNENFAILCGCADDEESGGGVKYHCLFDTCDLYVSQDSTAADRSIPMQDVVKPGDEMTYNACLIDSDSMVSYLATAVWRSGERAFDVPPMPRSAIQEEKVCNYKQVVVSCPGFIEKAEREAQRGENRSVLLAEQKKKQEEIRRRAEEIRELERQENAKTERLERQRQQVMDIAARARREAEARKRGITPITAPDNGDEKPDNFVHYDLWDWRTKAQLHVEKCELFALLKLWNGEIALVSSHRVWINTKPKFGGWNPLNLSYFK